MNLHVNAEDLADAIKKLPHPMRTDKQSIKVLLTKPDIGEPLIPRPPITFVFTFRNDFRNWALMQIERC
jgi:hypothetical protein